MGKVATTNQWCDIFLGCVCAYVGSNICVPLCSTLSYNDHRCTLQHRRLLDTGLPTNLTLRWHLVARSCAVTTASVASRSRAPLHGTLSRWSLARLLHSSCSRPSSRQNCSWNPTLDCSALLCSVMHLSNSVCFVKPLELSVDLSWR